MHKSCARLLRRASSLVPRPSCRHRSYNRSFSKLTSYNAHPDPFEQQTAYWADPANSRDVYIYPIGMGARHIVLNRPKALSSLSLPMISQLSSIVSAIEKDVDVGLAIMSGAGGKAFCAGGDIRALYDAGLKRKSLNNLTGPSDPTKLFFKKEYELNFQLSHTRVPLVPVLNGIVMGGGFGISGHLRYRCATPESMFARSFSTVGVNSKSSPDRTQKNFSQPSQSAEESTNNNQSYQLMNLLVTITSEVKSLVTREEFYKSMLALKEDINKNIAQIEKKVENIWLRLALRFIGALLVAILGSLFYLLRIPVSNMLESNYPQYFKKSV